MRCARYSAPCAARRLGRGAAALLISAQLVGCSGPEEHEDERPLRPLLYTESPSEQTEVPQGFEEWSDPTADPLAYPSTFAPVSQRSRAESLAVRDGATTPEELLEGFYEALLSGERDALDPWLFDPEELRVSARMNRATAEREAERIRSGSMDALTIFVSRMSADAREGGLRRQLRLAEVRIGAGRRLDGALTEEEDEVRLHWANELEFRHTDHNLSFTLRFPRILLGEDGHWRLQEAPTVDAAWRAFRGSGMDLRPELMDAEHSAFPLATGNFWHFRARRGALERDDSIRSAEEPGYRDEITRIEDFGAYRIVRFERRWDPPNNSVEYPAWLQTPRRLYHCSRECLRRREDVEWIVAHAQHQTPFLLLPPERGSAWGIGGSSRGSAVYRNRTEPLAVDVPAGRFDDAWEIVRQRADGRESWALARGIGWVEIRTVSAAATTVYELRDYRILP